jgi:hypothetical protein
MERARFVKWMLGVAGVCAMLMALYVLGGWWRIGVHFAVNQICVGVSAGKIYFALAFSMLFCLRAAWLGWRQRETHAAWNRRGMVVFALVVGVGLVCSLTSLVLYTRAMGLPTGSVNFHWRDGVNSVNSFTHIHTSKAPIAMVVEWLGRGEWHQRFDTGFAYLRVVPRWLAGLIGGAFVGALGLGLWVGPRVACAYADWRERVVVAMVMSLAFAALIKSVVDGGLFAYDAVAGTLAIVLLARADSLARVGEQLRRQWVGPALVVVVWLGVVAIMTPGGTIRQGEEWLERIAMYAMIVLAGVLWARASGRRVRSVVSGAAVCGVMWMSFVVGDFRARVLPLMARAQGEAVVYGAGGTVEIAETNGESRASVYVRLGDNPMRARRVMLATRTGQVTGIYADVVLVQTLAAGVTLSRSDVLWFKRADLVQSETGAGPARLRSQIAFDVARGPVVYSDVALDQIAENNRFVAYFVIDDYLRSVGVREYVFVPYLQFRDEGAASVK